MELKLGAFHRPHLKEPEYLYLYLFMQGISDSNTVGVDWSGLFFTLDIQDVQRSCIFHENKKFPSYYLWTRWWKKAALQSKQATETLLKFLPGKFCWKVTRLNQNSLVHYWSILHKSIKSSSNWKVFLVRRLHPLSNFEVPWKKMSKGITFSLN